MDYAKAAKQVYEAIGAGTISCRLPTAPQDSVL